MTEITIGIYTILVVIAMIAWLIIIGQFNPFILSDVTAYDSTAFPNLTLGGPASACSVRYHTFSLLQLAGLSAIAINPMNDQVRSETIKYLFDSDVLNWSVYNGSVSALMMINNGLGTVGVFRPVLDRTDVGFLVENRFNLYFPTGMEIIIPLFRIMNNL
jgi:hypothetical protein